ncbi:conjugative transfer signal peptidase TraF [Desulfovibrio cuneatus]|uniref:conjugative transfer signal peptidase TraF n=1 Tax=Desulfovibrio cuneatus TaxID=159728 RepID=UPI0003FDEEFB|nr:conjugative transfer signal peptidase TraF [Desulfovibrio cuneatus]
MNAISWSKSSWWLAVPYALVLVGCLAHAAGFRINPTPSLPKGLYRLTEGPPVKGDLVTFCLQGEFAELALQRGYLQAGSCPSGLRPLLKRLAGLPGDYIEADALAIRSVDSQGRHMPSVLQSGVIPSGMAFVLADHAGSFDSRYFGCVPLQSLHQMEKVLTW